MPLVVAAQCGPMLTSTKPPYPIILGDDQTIPMQIRESGGANLKDLTGLTATCKIESAGLTTFAPTVTIPDPTSGIVRAAITQAEIAAAVAGALGTLHISIWNGDETLYGYDTQPLQFVLG